MPSERWQEDILAPCFYTTLAGNERHGKTTAACFKQPVPPSTQAENTTEPISAVPRDQKPSQGPAAQPHETQHPIPIPIHEPTGSTIPPSTIPPRLLQLEISYNIATGKKTLNCNKNSSEFCSFCFPLLLQRVSFPCFGEGAQGKAWKWYINHENIPTHAPRLQTFCFITYRSFMLKRQNRGA